MRTAKTKTNVVRFVTRVIPATLLCVALTFSVTGCDGKGENAGGGTTQANAEFDKLMADLYKDEVTDDTFTLHFSLKDPEAYGITRPEATFGDLDTSDFMNEKGFEEMQETLDQLETFDYSTLNEEQQLTCTVLKRYITQELSCKDINYGLSVFGEISGVPGNLPLNFSLYEFYKKQDIEDYLSLLDQTDEYMDYCIAYENFRTDQGYGMSDAAIDTAIEQCDTILAQTENNFLITTFDHRIDKLDFLTAEEAKDYKTRNRDLVLNVFLPAFEKTKKDLDAMHGTSEEKGGLCNYPGGKEYYKYIIAHKTGSPKSIEEIQQLMEHTLEDSSQMLYEIYSEDPAIVNAYYNDEVFELSNGLEDPRDFMEFYKEKMVGFYPTPTEITYEISDIDPSIADNLSPAFCVTPCLDDYTHGVIQVNRSEDNRSSGELSATYAHEGYPGHLNQLTYFAEHNNYPIRNIPSFLGYDEGWAMFVEFRSYNLMDYKNYDSENVRKLFVANQLQELALCCLIDIKVNYEGYSKEQIADYLDDQGFNGAAADDLYPMMVQEPGYYPQYFLGYLEYAELYHYTKTTLGADFSELEYQEVVLLTGPCDFTTLREQMDAYIATKQQD